MSCNLWYKISLTPKLDIYRIGWKDVVFNLKRFGRGDRRYASLPSSTEHKMTALEENNDRTVENFGDNFGTFQIFSKNRK